MLRHVVVIASCIGALSTVVAGAREAPRYQQDVTGFVSAKGERALVMGYPDGLEIWAWPLQLASDYRLRFRVAGVVDPIDAGPLLRSVERTPAEVVRTYVGATFVVRERLFVPRRQAGTILRYEVEGRPDVQVEASFRPSLNLMWPAALGGRSVGWDAARSGYVEREPLHGFSATISSAEAIAHDDPVNYARQPAERLAMLLAPRPDENGRRHATIVFALDPEAKVDGANMVRQGETAARVEAKAHVAAVLDQSIAVESPDPAADKALLSAVLALDGAWACNDRLGCGALAGYGLSRPDRRPQYAWFFAGDGLVAMEGMLAAGQFERAREELAFVTRYQDPRTGMIWHEMSQSAGLIDWVGKYHYMYVHVDITFQYLAAVRRYVATTGDVGFVRDNWRALLAAWAYCISVIDPATGLPGIPPGKQGQNEQEDLRDDIRLSTLWIDAADGFAELAALQGNNALAAKARSGAARARSAIATNGWDDASGFWLSGHRRDGTPVRSLRPDAIGVLGQGVVSPERAGRLLDRIATPDFMTDWGVRSLSASDPHYDPNLYSAGSVWTLGSATVAEAFWRQHRPLNAWAIWRGMAAGDTLDSAGHLHEVMAGDLYHPEFESVPEQTWSSAGLLLAAMRGMYGLDVHGAERRLTFAPHLPPEWGAITLRNVRVGRDRITLTMRQDAEGTELDIENPGSALAIDFEPMLPLGAGIRGAMVDGKPVAAKLVSEGQDQHARLKVDAIPHGVTHVRIEHAGGVGIAAMSTPIAIGARSRNPIVAGVAMTDNVLRLDAWTSPEGSTDFLLTTDRVPGHVTGGQTHPAGKGRYRLSMSAAGGMADRASGYVRRTVTVELPPSP
ncbi:amylo-alpha-1,6-glucosidase [Sphingomonas mollis]|uniref:Mannosylglycerate hydrolase MGH1-like glycoside hydrolase domain-containing protein n=1 Tax=Sphingomonas mollis TaxID=2795726 RepID=A0ABS0XL44_9SPHN|nr:amylo-alpha-1,6-glucosidase [Sphingomonas sp. BT553]MBJ6120749.1 hypothetical protein [Sphingomonas sp. BT553]